METTGPRPTSLVSLGLLIISPVKPNFKYLLSTPWLTQLLPVIYLNCCYSLGPVENLPWLSDLNPYNKARQKWLRSHFMDDTLRHEDLVTCTRSHSEWVAAGTHFSSVRATVRSLPYIHLYDLHFQRSVSVFKCLHVVLFTQLILYTYSPYSWSHMESDPARIFNNGEVIGWVTQLLSTK